MARRPKTGFDRFFDDQLEQPGFAKGYVLARAEIDAVDQIIRALDEARIETGLSKAELARLISAKPEIIRRLFTAESANPTLETIVKIASALGYKLELVPVRKAQQRSAKERHAAARPERGRRAAG
jgi:ribosome-binding protein aMBF1 (putative translation factor)